MFFPFVRDPRECMGYVAIPPFFAPPPPEKAGKMKLQLLILSPRLALGTPENAGVT